MPASVVKEPVIACRDIAALWVFAMLSAAVGAQNTEPCSAPQHRQLDFWQGEWDLAWEPFNANDPGVGRNTISLMLDDCVVQEAFSGAGLRGHSVSVFHAPSGRWRQTWVDSSGGYFALTGGPDHEGFRLDLTRLDDNAPHMRMIWRNVRQDSMDWHWQRSEDAGQTWQDQWVIHYVRRLE